MFIKFFVLPATPLPPLALEMDTQDAEVTLIRSVAKLQLLKFDARSLYFERASYLNLVEPGEYRIFCSHFGTFCQTVVKSCSCQFLVTWFMGKRLVLNDLFVRR